MRANVGVSVPRACSTMAPKKQRPASKAQEPVSKPWESCSICSSIPDASSELVKGGESDGPGLPTASLKLEIVGAPYFDDSTSGSNRCFKRCPECGSMFRWENEYEYLVNGSEDDTSLIRLELEDGKKALADTLHEVAVRRKVFQVEGVRRVHLLKTTTSASVIDEAAGFFDHHQICYKEDITFAIPALIGALVRHEHRAEKCNAGQRLFWALSGYARESKEHSRLVLDTLQSFAGKPFPPEVDELMKHTNIKSEK